jgi:hypothetical protein
MRILHRRLYEFGKNIGDVLGQRGSVVTPTPDGHAADFEESRRHRVAAKNHPEREMVSSSG